MPVLYTHVAAVCSQVGLGLVAGYSFVASGLPGQHLGRAFKH